MCGIYLSNNLNFEQSMKGFGSIKHRGPNSTKYIVDKTFFYGHHRLSITGEGSQPLNINNKILTVNGELYDFKNIAKNHNFFNKMKTTSDSEIIIYLYELYQYDLFKYLNGEFSFILHDIKKNKIIFARDRFGIKPLYYKLNNNQIIISSEMKGIKNSGIRTKINEESLSFSLNFQYLNPGETLLNINECKPGYFYIYDLKTNKIKENLYYDISFNREENENDKEEIKQLLLNSIDIRTKEVKKYTTYLSGGIDSSLITSISKKFNEKLIESFNIDFKENGERIFAEEVCSYKNIKLNSFLFSEEKIINSIEKSVYYSEGLSINKHLPVKFILNKIIKDKGYDIILSGEGSDEFFIGYPHFKKDLGINISDKERKFYDKYQLTNNKIENSLIEKKIGFIPQWLLTKLNLFKNIEDYLDIKIDRKFNEEKFLSNIPSHIHSSIDISIYSWSKFCLNGYILRTLDDGLSMAHGLESRTPFLDYNLVDKLNNTSINKLMNLNGMETEKGLLKDISIEYLPESIINRTKQSFLGDDILSEKIMIENIKKYLPIKKIPEDKILLFYLNTLSLFYKQFL